MKKLFILLLAAMAFVACNEEKEFIDYSTWTVEELLTTGGGIDYLVSQTKKINYDELNERLKTEVLFYNDSRIYTKRDDVWTTAMVDGNLYPCFVLMENNTFRMCFEVEHEPMWGMLYRTYNVGDNAVVEMVEQMDAGAKIVAYIGDTLVVEYYWNGDSNMLTRALAYFADCREWVLNTYTNNWDDPASWMPR